MQLTIQGLSISHTVKQLCHDPKCQQHLRLTQHPCTSRLVYNPCMPLFQAPQDGAMIFFTWQDDIIGVSRSLDVSPERVCTSAGSPMGTRHLISPSRLENM